MGFLAEILDGIVTEVVAAIQSLIEGIILGFIEPILASLGIILGG